MPKRSFEDLKEETRKFSEDLDELERLTTQVEKLPFRVRRCFYLAREILHNARRQTAKAIRTMKATAARAAGKTENGK